jgi:hypothetical protein
MFHSQASNAFKNINSATTTTVKVGAGILHSITINTPVAGAITLFDNTAASGTVIGLITTTAASQGTMLYDVEFRTGLTILTATANDITVCFA